MLKITLLILLAVIIGEAGMGFVFVGNRGLGITLCAIAGAMAPLISYGVTKT